MIKELWKGVSLTEFNNWFPLTGKINETPEQYIKTWSDVEEWFKTFALRAQNDINAYLNDILRRFDFSSFKDKRIQETLIDMVFLCVEHWVYNRTPIEFNSDASMTFNNGQTQINSFGFPTINIFDLHPSRMKIWANFTELKRIFDTAEEGQVDPTLIDLDQYYTKTQTDLLLDEKQDKTDKNLDTKDKTVIGAINEIKTEIPDVTVFETKEAHNEDIIFLESVLDTKVNKNYVDEELMKKQEKLTLVKNEASGDTNADLSADGKLRIWDASFENADLVKNYRIITSNSGVSRLDTDIPTCKHIDDEYQLKNDNRLVTEAKEVVPAINEINSRVPDRNLFYTKPETDELLNKKSNKENWVSVGKNTEGFTKIEYDISGGKWYKLFFTISITVEKHDTFGILEEWKFLTQSIPETGEKLVKVVTLSSSIQWKIWLSKTYIRMERIGTTNGSFYGLKELKK